ncbi:MAG: pyridoxamine 5-phosphate oxidase-related, FMN-binding protein [Marmoricola sp.]|nr:pyridoxamine 5-phosphate oxidase-related, FMN-binding protein [Marmoricola sp.]
MPDAIALSSETCEELLRSGVVGRIVFSTPHGLQVFPVNYSVVDRAVVIRVSPYGPLGVHGQDAKAAFEIDQFDHGYQHGWSVVAHGRLTAVRDPEEYARIESIWRPRPWATGVSRNLWLKLPWSELTGRRLGRGWDLRSELVTRRGTPTDHIPQQRSSR